MQRMQDKSKAAKSFRSASLVWAHLTQRLLSDITVRLNFKADHQNLDDIISRNLIAEIPGSEFPDEVTSSDNYDIFCNCILDVRCF